MPLIHATEKQSFLVHATLEKVYKAFADPNAIKKNMVDLEKYHILDDGSVRWILKEMQEKGVRFKGDYTVSYQGNGTNHVTWKSEKGNIQTQGEVHITSENNAIRIQYLETIAPDLPIPKIMATIFKPIVAREVRKGIQKYLDNVKTYLKNT